MSEISTQPARVRTLEEYHAAYEQSVADPDAFWAAAAEPFTWRRKWDTVRGGQFSPAGQSTWFEGARLNITENCLDRHLGPARPTSWPSSSSPTTPKRATSA